MKKIKKQTMIVQHITSRFTSFCELNRGIKISVNEPSMDLINLQYKICCADIYPTNGAVINSELLYAQINKIINKVIDITSEYRDNVEIEISSTETLLSVDYTEQESGMIVDAYPSNIPNHCYNKISPFYTTTMEVAYIPIGDDAIDWWAARLHYGSQESRTKHLSMNFLLKSNGIMQNPLCSSEQKEGIIWVK